MCWRLLLLLYMYPCAWSVRHCKHPSISCLHDFLSHAPHFTQVHTSSHTPRHALAVFQALGSCKVPLRVSSFGHWELQSLLPILGCIGLVGWLCGHLEYVFMLDLLFPRVLCYITGLCTVLHSPPPPSPPLVPAPPLLYMHNFHIQVWSYVCTYIHMYICVCVCPGWKWTCKVVFSPFQGVSIWYIPENLSMLVKSPCCFWIASLVYIHTYVCMNT